MSHASNHSSTLLNRVRAACQPKGYSDRTEQSYTRWIVRSPKSTPTCFKTGGPERKVP